MRTAGVYLLFAAVTLRAIVVFAGDPQLPLVVALLALYGLLLVAGPRLLRQRMTSMGLDAAPEVTGKLPWDPAVLRLLYIAVQCGLVIALLVVPATEDFFGNLFVLLGMDAVLYFGRRAGFLVILIFSLITAVALASSAQGPLFGGAMAFLYGGVAFLLGGFAYQMQIAEAVHHHNARLVAELQEAHRQLQSYVMQAEEMAAEQERGWLARELHDSVTQTVFSMNLTVQGAALLLTREPARVAEQLVRLEALAGSAMREIQCLVSHLGARPVAAAEELPGALHRLAAERLAKDGLQLSLDVSGERDLPAPVALGLYAIVQEALNNVARHAATGHACVRLNLAEGGAWLEILDEGTGFDPQAALAEPGHLGLESMAERAREIGWQLLIDSGQGRGTRVRVAEQAPGAVC